MLKANILQKELVAIMLLELKKFLNRDHRKLNYSIFVKLFFFNFEIIHILLLLEILS